MSKNRNLNTLTRSLALHTLAYSNLAFVETMTRKQQEYPAVLPNRVDM